VFVVFPKHCPQPERGGTITVYGELAPDLGSASYRVLACA
jgi:hypothetical protein